jgi:hypothetical protein
MENGHNSDIIWNLLTAVVFLAIVVVIGVFALVFINPTMAYNPFPPLPIPVSIQLPTDTPTDRPTLPPTWTATSTELPTATFTPRPPPPPTPTLFSIKPSDTPTRVLSVTPTTTLSNDLPYALRNNINAISADSFNVHMGCNWMGVAGQVFDLQNAPVTQMFIQLGGSLASTSIDMPSMTGTATLYGKAGYEFTIADRPIASKKTVWLQLLDQAGLALSPRVYFDTSDVCQNNLILVNFKQVRE